LVIALACCQETWPSGSGVGADSGFTAALVKETTFPLTIVNQPSGEVGGGGVGLVFGSGGWGGGGCGEDSGVHGAKRCNLIGL
jgi:hypothetical protein